MKINWEKIAYGVSIILIIIGITGTAIWIYDEIIDDEDSKTAFILGMISLIGVCIELGTILLIGLIGMFFKEKLWKKKNTA